MPQLRHEFCAHLCKTSYHPEGIPGAVAVGALGPKAFFCKRDAVVVFRGTNDTAGWLQDLMADPVAWNNGTAGRVHRGFLECWEAMRRDLVKIVGTKQVTVTGHSLGGALATLAACALHVREVVTFGSPRVGDADFGAAYHEAVQGKTTRYVHGLDPVPLVPGSCAGFRHVVPEKWFDGAKWRPLTLLGSLPFLLKRWRHDRERLWKDHDIDRYLAAFEKDPR